MRHNYAQCFTCGKMGYWKNLQCAHYISRRYLSLRYNAINCQACCENCNVFLNGNLDKFAEELKLKYGDSILQELEAKKNQITKYSAWVYEILIQEYKSKIKDCA